MKLLPVILAFLAGAIIASAVWCVLLVRCQIEMAANYVTTADGECRVGERIVSYIGHPDPAAAHLLILSASNHLAGLPHEVDYWDKRYPYMHIERRSAPMIEAVQMFLQTNSVLNATQSQPNDALEPTPTAPPVLTNK